MINVWLTHCNTLQHIASHCNTLQQQVCEAAVGWLETHHYDRLMAELELRDDLIHKLDR